MMSVNVSSKPNFITVLIPATRCKFFIVITCEVICRYTCSLDFPQVELTRIPGENVLASEALFVGREADEGATKSREVLVPRAIYRRRKTFESLPVHESLIVPSF